MHVKKNLCEKLVFCTLLAVITASVCSAADPLPLPYRSDFFPILPWDTMLDPKHPEGHPVSGLSSIAECGFTIAGFVRPEQLPVCEKLGLAAIIASGGKKWTELSDDQIDQAVKTMVESAGDSKAILGYYIQDEPGAGAFPALAKVVAAVKKHAPGKIAYINLFPGYATVGAPDSSQLGTATFTEYLERFVTEVKPQILSYDNYMVQYSDDLEETSKAAIYYHDLLEVRRVALKYKLPFWNIVSSNQIRPHCPIPSSANLSFQAYTTLAAGGRGVSWYKYYQHGYAYAPVANTGHRTETWRYLATVNHRVKTLGPIMNRLHSTGVYFSSPPPVPSLPLLPGKVLAEVQSIASPRGVTDVKPPVMVGEFVDQDGTAHVMIVNLSLQESANIKLKTHAEYQHKQVFSAADGRLLPLDEKNGHWLVAGHGVLVQLF